jgi:hypothetical protein
MEKWYWELLSNVLGVFGIADFIAGKMGLVNKHNFTNYMGVSNHS